MKKIATSIAKATPKQTRTQKPGQTSNQTYNRPTPKGKVQNERYYEK